MGLFSGLEKIGLGKLQDLEVFEEEKKPQSEGGSYVAKPQVIDDDLLFDKTHLCPVFGE